LKDLTDEALMLNYCLGQAAAFDELYARHKGGLYRYINRQLGNRVDYTNELFQDVWMKVIKSRSRYKDSAKFSTYLYHIAHNRMIDHWRNQKLEVKSEIEVDTMEIASPLPDDLLQQQEYIDQLKQQLVLLPEDQRQAFVLQQESGLSLEDIANVTGVNRETVKSRLRYAFKRLRHGLALLQAGES
jgi:RNA polymerase sigma-70 factor, ECF subfamily